MADPTYADATTAQPQATIRDGLLASLAASGSAVGGLPMSSPDRGLVEADAAQLAVEQSTRAMIAQSATVTGAAAVSDAWTDADATWYQVSNGQGGTGRIPAQAAVWTVGLAVAPTAAPVTIQPGTILQIQAADANHTVFNFTNAVAVTLSSGSSYKATAQFTARAAGAAGPTATELQNGKIITSGIAGLDVDATVLPTLVTAGRDPETSQALAARCLASWGRLGAGWILSSFDYLIPILATSVTRWNVDDSSPLGPGTIRVTLANPSGPATTQEINEVRAGLNARNVRPVGTPPVTVEAALAHPLTINVTLAGDGTNPNLQTNATTALQALGAAIPVGPCAIPLSLVLATAIGGAFSGNTPLVAGNGPPFPTVEMPLALPGFRGAATVATFTTSTGNLETTGFETLLPREVLELTVVVTVE